MHAKRERDFDPTGLVKGGELVGGDGSKYRIGLPRLGGRSENQFAAGLFRDDAPTDAFELLDATGLCRALRNARRFQDGKELGRVRSLWGGHCSLKGNVRHASDGQRTKPSSFHQKLEGEQ